MTIPWEEGVIGRVETFLRERFPIGPMYARALASSIVSIALFNLTLYDKMGIVRPCVWYLDVAKSGLGYKTPPLWLIREVMKKFAKDLISPSKFTPEGFTEWVTGTKGNEKRKPIPPHYANFIIRDEFSKLLGEINSSFLTRLEFFSELWDGWIEGYYTRKMQYEGNVDVFVTMLSVSSADFFNQLTKRFFTQGLGNRILWIIEKGSEPKMLGEDFFFEIGEEDTEKENLVEGVVKDLRALSSLKSTFLTKEARVIWMHHEHEIRKTLYGEESMEASFKAKQPLNILKLAMIYAASRKNWNPSAPEVLIIGKEDMLRAVEDTKIHLGMWYKAIELWQKEKISDRTEERIPSTRYELLDFVGVGLHNGSLLSVPLVSATLDLPDRTRIGKILALGVTKEWITIDAEMGEQGNLTDEEYVRFKSKHGPSPQIFKVTQKGRKEYERTRL